MNLNKRIRVVKNPTESIVIMVTKSEIIKLKEKYPSISMGNHDDNYLKDFKFEDTVGVVAGDIDNIDNPNADLWFVNINYFNEHYTIIQS